MKITLTSVEVKNGPEYGRYKNREIDLPGCLQNMSGIPLIVGVYEEMKAPSSSIRVWYLTNMEQ